MKKFCECDNEWLPNSDMRSRRQLVLVDTPEILEHKYSLLIRRGPTFRCVYCQYWFWYDADYENMMFDLREMNL